MSVAILNVLYLGYLKTFTLFILDVEKLYIMMLKDAQKLP